MEIAECISFDYGQTHLRELEAAKRIAGYYSYSHRVVEVDFSFIKPGVVGHLLKAPKEFSPMAAQLTVKDKTGENVSATFVPGRNIIFFAIAGAIADSEGCNIIVSGVNAEDYSGYPDCRPKFINSMNEALNDGLRAGVLIYAPVLRMKKVEIIQNGIELGAPLQLTWSCYAGREKPCGNCPSCLVRAKGFLWAGVEDPGLK
jgi:7-cyano-7-deazaguanine synthase